MSVTSNKYKLYRLIWTGLDLLLPPNCGGCGKPGSRWCTECQQNVINLNVPFCEICGIPIRKKGICSDCLHQRPSYKILRSWSAFDNPIKNALHRLKYRRDIGLGDALAQQLLEFVSKLNWPIEVVIPVPLGRKRLDERGYNQVGLIARPLSMAMKIAYYPQALSRDHETRTQVGLTRMERHFNVQGAFTANEKYVDGRNVLLIDDVATTGSTITSCAEALYAACARDVFALTVSRALSRHSMDLV
jgi:competence protein ComFC